MKFLNASGNGSQLNIFLNIFNKGFRCGFSKVSHIDDIDQQFPNLDVNSRKKRERMVRYVFY